MSIDRVYLVVGSTGEYSDHTQWNVAAYTDKEQADLHAAAANEAVKGAEDMDWEERQLLKEQATLDAVMSISYTGTEYSVEEVPLFLHFDLFQDWMQDQLREKENKKAREVADEDQRDSF